MNLNTDIDKLLIQQTKEWDLAQENFKSLETIQERELNLGKCIVRIQYNSKRIKSTGANVSKDAIKKRKCFLCSSNRPVAQRSIDYNDYDILINPFPILKGHLTIAHKKHIPQSVDYYIDMFELARSLDSFTILYNGAECGASAPDHLHFQACKKGLTQTEIDFKNCVGDRNISKAEYCRKLTIIKSRSIEDLSIKFKTILSNSIEYSSIYKDAKLNLMCRYDEGEWTLYVFHRKAHRPSSYGVSYLVSPGLIDMSGIIICPREEDYLNLNEKDVIKIYNEVSD